MYMEACKDRGRTESTKTSFTFKKSLLSICFRIILTSPHKLGENTSPVDASLSFWKINLMIQKSK